VFGCALCSASVYSRVCDMRPCRSVRVMVSTRDLASARGWGPAGGRMRSKRGAVGAARECTLVSLVFCTVSGTCSSSSRAYDDGYPSPRWGHPSPREA